MIAFLLANERYIRIAFFLAILAPLVAWEVAVPRRREIPRVIRWTNNSALLIRCSSG